MEGLDSWHSERRAAAWTPPVGDMPDDCKLMAVDAERPDTQTLTGQIGSIRFAQVTCRSGAVDRVPTPFAQDSAPGFTLIVQLEGHGTLSQYGQQAELAPGDLALSDNGAPLRHRIEPGSSLLLLRMPAKALRSQLPTPEHFCGRRLSANGAMTAVATSLARNVCSQAQRGLPPALHDCLSRQLLETIALAFTHAYGLQASASSVVVGRYARARLFIEQNLGDPELGPHAVARALNVSARYLRMIFATEGECISTYVLRRRLEESARQLADARWRGRSICEIAFNWGFNSAPHFSRSFREHYGMTPRDYRARCIGSDGSIKSDTLAAAV